MTLSRLTTLTTSKHQYRLHSYLCHTTLQLYRLEPSMQEMKRKLINEQAISGAFADIMLKLLMLLRTSYAIEETF